MGCCSADKTGLKAKDIVLSIDGRPIDSLPKYTIWLYRRRTPPVAGVVPDLRSSAGVMVAAIVDYEPIISADLAVGDVIRPINGQPVKTVDGFRTQLLQFKPAEPVVLEVERQGVYQFVSFEAE